MLVPFDQLPADSRVWVYQSPRIITADEQQLLLSRLSIFIDTWTAHQAGLRASVTLLHDRFIIISVDENHNHASGCSIDKMVHFMKTAGDDLGIDFFDRMTVARMDERGEISTFKISEAANLMSIGQLNSETRFFNNLITSLAELENSWLVPVEGSWLMNFAPR